MFALGTWINVAAILLGGGLGMLIRGELSAKRQNQLRTGVGLGVILVGFHQIWTGLRPVSLGAAFGLIGIALLATSVGHALGKLMKVQAGMSRLGRFAAETYARTRKQPRAVGINDAFMACAVLFCVGPLSLLGPLQEGLNGDFFVLVVKAAMDGLAAFAFARAFGWAVVLSGLPVLALQGTITLLVAWAVTRAPEPEVLHATNVTGGLLVVCAVLLVFEVRKVQIGDYLPALVIAPLLAWLFF